MLDMISLLTLLNSAKEKDEEEGKEVATTNILTHLETGSKVSTFEEGNVVEERDGVLLIGIFMIALLGLVLIVVAVYFFRKMVALDNLQIIWKSLNFDACHQVLCCKQKRREEIFRAKFNKPPVLERV